MKTPIERWSSKVNMQENDCWLWTGAKTRGGYGHFRMFISNVWKMYKAHRFSYEHFNNVKLENDVLVCHKCDNPCCVNPDHLFIGNAQENVTDKVSKGRHKYGRKLGNSWLSQEIADKIRLTYSIGEYTMKQVGEMFNTSASQVERIINNKIWKTGGTQNSLPKLR